VPLRAARLDSHAHLLYQHDRGQSRDDRNARSGVGANARAARKPLSSASNEIPAPLRPAFGPLVTVRQAHTPNGSSALGSKPFDPT
jgi:hypothetical protein